MSLPAVLASRRAVIESALEHRLPAARGPAATVARAMRHAVLGGGKRLRPTLAIAACEACGGTVDDVLAPAVALELIHTYSLVHDDLPAMDDDDLRRGRPTVHREFGEAAAILAGDALLTLGFEILAAEPAGDAHAARRAEAVLAVARAVGVDGMVGGQQADLEAEGAGADAERLEWIHRHKTGALLGACAEVGAIHAGAAPATRRALARFGQQIGLAFQIADDVLDETESSEALGKTAGKDQRARKATWPSLHGLARSRAQAQALAQQAAERLRQAGLRDTSVLEALARTAVQRSR